jgi:hypothetical protein
MTCDPGHNADSSFFEENCFAHARHSGDIQWRASAAEFVAALAAVLAAVLATRELPPCASLAKLGFAGFVSAK